MTEVKVVGGRRTLLLDVFRPEEDIVG
jgi:hypothetical protein